MAVYPGVVVNKFSDTAGPDYPSVTKGSLYRVNIYKEGLAGDPEEVEVVEGNEIEATVVAFDPDDDALELSASSDDLPEGWQFTDNNDNTMTIFWTPSFDDAGEYTLTLTASDDEFDVAVDVRIIVRDDNRPPVLTEIGDQEVDENEELAFTLEATDPDRDNITFYGDDID